MVTVPKTWFNPNNQKHLDLPRPQTENYTEMYAISVTRGKQHLAEFCSIPEKTSSKCYQI